MGLKLQVTGVLPFLWTSTIFETIFEQYLLFMHIGGIEGIFLILQNVIRIYKYILELVEGSINLLASLS